ncbi:MAG TPA: penicillin-binding protein 1B, partial [Gammaproteobacteria bacterium]|nr:penicillin-binding protein 1B [Gammaproteobacteria bacterium]
RNVLEPIRNWFTTAALTLTLISLLCGLAYTAYLDHRLREQFEGARWELPARVFARPLELYVGKMLSADALMNELNLLHYQFSQSVTVPGEYRREGDAVGLYSRGFPFWDAVEPPQSVRVIFSDDRVTGVFSAKGGAPLDLVRLEPVPIANIYPTHLEDRLITRLESVPPLLIKALLTVEDRGFYYHHGLDFKAIARAMVANLKAGQVVQGGSTLTQQLVKNLFLSDERSLLRKLKEAIMAELLEWHYSKDEVLEAYINEVYLGQDGRRAIHGFALASQFYFEQRLSELRPEQIALLVALVRGPSYYEPRRNPRRAKARRDLVLSELEEQGIITASVEAQSQRRSLGVTANAPSGVTPFPAFVELMHHQLLAHYPEQALRTKGLVIFTTLDPLIQIETERAVAEQLTALEESRGLPINSLQAAVVVTAVETGEVLALVGGRNPRLQGYNRALDAKRPIGSLIKPVIYLTALSRPQDYTLATLLDDEPLSIRLFNNQTWSPQNYDQRYHGEVTLRDSLVDSYNVSTARLGLSLGINKVIATMRRLGLARSLPSYPSLLLGAVEMTPMEISEVYQTIANGGYRTPLITIREVMSNQGEPLEHYLLQITQAADPRAVYLLNTALFEVTRQGTARALQDSLPQELKVAGKTGTTDGLRDSWFAGFSGKHLAVVWIGRDDNRSTDFTGASGALPVWADIVQKLSTRSLNLNTPAKVKWQLVDTQDGLLADKYCEHAQWMPFITGTAPTQPAPCMQHRTSQGPTEWLKDFFN